MVQGALHNIQRNFSPEIKSSFIFEEELSLINTNIATCHKLAVLLVAQIGKARVGNYHFI